MDHVNINNFVISYIEIEIIKSYFPDLLSNTRDNLQNKATYMTLWNINVKILEEFK